MTLKDYLIVHNEGIKSIGLYDENGQPINVDVDAMTVIPYLENEVKEVRLGIFDKPERDATGKHYTTQYIRACIELKCKEEIKCIY